MRKVAFVIAILFVVFYVVTQPTQAADAVRGAADALLQAFDSVVEFLSALFR